MKFSVEKYFLTIVLFRRFIQRYNMKQHVKTHKGAFMDLENQSSPSLIPQNLTIPQNLSNSSSSLNLTT